MAMTSLFIFTILIATVIILLYFFIKRKLEYFSSRGIPHVDFTFGDFLKSFSMDSFGGGPNLIYRMVRNDGNPVIGFFRMLDPSILVVDPEIVEKILIKEFSHFHDHGFMIDTKLEPLAGHLFNMKGDQWRVLRHKLLPTFTSGKLKGMVPIMEECAEKLITEMKENSAMRNDVDLKNLFKRYTISVIALCVYAIDPESLKDPNCEFRLLLDKLLNPSFIQCLKTAVIVLLPRLNKLLKFKFILKEIDDFYINLVKDTLEMRKQSGIKRNDFVQLLLELKEKGSVQVDAKDLEEDEKKVLQASESEDGIKNKLEITDELLAAQAFVFIEGGFENTSQVMSIVMYLLSKHKDVQDNVRLEVKDAISKHGGMNYLALRDMKLLDASINETLRMYPPAIILMRKCNKTVILDNGITIEKGTEIIIPAKGLHEDDKYWTNPEKYDPERFLNSNITPGAYLPFGDGPRMCIAQRFALVMMKVILAQLLVNFEPKVSSKTKEPIKLSLSVPVKVEGGLWGSFEPFDT